MRGSAQSCPLPAEEVFLLSLDESLGTPPGAFGSWIVSWVHRREEGRASPDPLPGAGLQGSDSVHPRAAWAREHTSSRVPWESLFRPPCHWKAGQQGACRIFHVICGIRLEPPEASPCDVLPAMEETLSMWSLCHQSPSCLDSGVTRVLASRHLGGFSVVLPPAGCQHPWYSPREPGCEEWAGFCFPSACSDGTTPPWSMPIFTR